MDSPRFSPTPPQSWGSARTRSSATFRGFVGDAIFASAIAGGLGERIPERFQSRRLPVGGRGGIGEVRLGRRAGDRRGGIGGGRGGRSRILPRHEANASGLANSERRAEVGSRAAASPKGTAPAVRGVPGACGRGPSFFQRRAGPPEGDAGRRLCRKYGMIGRGTVIRHASPG